MRLATVDLLVKKLRRMPACERTSGDERVLEAVRRTEEAFDHSISCHPDRTATGQGPIRRPDRKKVLRMGGEGG